MSLFHTVRQISKVVGLGVKAAKMIELSNSAPIMSDQELRAYLVNKCEENNKRLPEDMTACHRLDNVSLTPGNSRSVTIQTTRLDLSRSSLSTKEISAVIEEHRNGDLEGYRTGGGFDKVCRANSVILKFILNDKSGRQLGVYEIGPSDLK